MKPLSFTARVIAGSGRGKKLGTPTMNLDLRDIPPSLEEGIYACRVESEGPPEMAAMHYGPRPVFHDSPSCEVHLLDRLVIAAPLQLSVTVVERIRDVQNFPSEAALQEQIAKDITTIRDILTDA